MNINLVAMSTTLLGWVVIWFLAYRIFKKQAVKPKIWKIIVVIWIGLFVFSFNFNVEYSVLKIPILPLGVWILYYFTKKQADRWPRYRPYAWLGFFANLIFLSVSLLSIPLNDAFYPQDKSSTFVANVKNGSLIKLHSSAQNVSLDKNALQKQIPLMKIEPLASIEWYNEADAFPDINDKNERFPYQLIGTKTKVGSGINTLIYVEKDGKGLLISTPNKQLYFRSEKSFLDGGK